MISAAHILVQPNAIKPDFHFTVSLTEAKTKFDVIAVGPKGGVERETIEIDVDDWRGLLHSMNRITT